MWQLDIHKDQLWSKFQQNSAFTGVIAQNPPKLGPKGYPKGKVENGKYTDLKTYKFISCGKIRMLQAIWEFVSTPWAGPRGQFRPKKWVFLINVIRILRFIWDLALVSFDSPKDVVSAKILDFGNIFGFLGVNWAQKWTKTEKFGYVPSVLKHLILKHCSYIAFVS